MKVYKGTFKKQDQSLREMTFSKLEDLPEDFLEEKIIGSGASKTLKTGMELVWDLESDNFRVFNWNTVVGNVQEYIM